MNAFKLRCIELRKKDHTLAEIVRITGRPKTSVYFHIQNLFLSESKRQDIRTAYARRAREIAAKRRGLSIRKFRPFSNWDRNTVSLVSHFLFDGEIKRGGCYYHNRNTSLIEKIEAGMRKIYNFKPKRYKNLATGVQRICYFNVPFSAHVKERADDLLRRVTTMPRALKREFLKAFFDDEGCIDFRPYKNIRRVRGYQKDVSILSIVKVLLEDMGIASNIKQPNEIVISGKSHLIRFQKEIDFSPGVRVNGKRSNSIWKRHLEKRVILSRAIRSYK